ncbi:ABC-type sugar transport system periplasmic component-like protein [Halogranum salarium B-1]|uniref:ABC-type sugar transport system periplasmic component-like protein n=1 Tax=Halogranum salarium B-1 TaxID=1210908 RepID=J3JDE1_9EURY|nr:ABC-type sugar transport system periplasmic component-like protein [Halogranum salarium B-1]
MSESQITELKNGDYSVAIVFHYLKTAWTRLQLKGLETRFDELGITLDSVSGAEFDASVQSDILNSVALSDADALVSIPVDTVATSKAYREVADSGIDIVFMDNVPAGFTPGDDYAGMVSSDNEGVGIVAGRFLKEFVGEGTVGLVEHNAPFYVTEQREVGARSVLEDTDDISIVAETGFTHPDEVYDRAHDILTSYPDLDGLFVSWDDPPGMQAAAAATDLGRDDLIITATDFTTKTAEMIAQDGIIKAVGAQFPYQQGRIEADMVGQALLGNETPPYIASGSLPVYRGNLLEQYLEHYQEIPPESVTAFFEETELTQK